MLSVKEFYNKAKNYYAKRRNDGLSEDFAQEACLEFIERGTYKLEWIYAHFLRREYGNTRSACGTERSRDRRFGARLDQPIKEGTNTGTLHDVISDTRMESRYERIDRRMLNLLGRQEYLVISLYSQDFLVQEIADILGLAPPRISQVLKISKSKIEKAKMLVQDLEEYKLGLIKNEFKIDWIKI